MNGDGLKGTRVHRQLSAVPFRPVSVHAWIFSSVRLSSLAITMV